MRWVIPAGEAQYVSSEKKTDSESDSDRDKVVAADTEHIKTARGQGATNIPPNFVKFLGVAGQRSEPFIADHIGKWSRPTKLFLDADGGLGVLLKTTLGDWTCG